MASSALNSSDRHEAAGPPPRARYDPLLVRGGLCESNGGSPVATGAPPPAALHMGSASSTMGGGGGGGGVSATQSLRASGANGTTGLMLGLSLSPCVQSPGAQDISTVACTFALGHTDDDDAHHGHAVGAAQGETSEDPFAFCLDVTGDDGDGPLAATAPVEGGASDSGETATTMATAVPTVTSTPSPFGSGTSRSANRLRRLSMDPSQLAPDTTAASGRGASGSVRLGRSPSVRALNEMDDDSSPSESDDDGTRIATMLPATALTGGGPLRQAAAAAATAAARKHSRPVAVKTITMADEDRRQSAESEMAYAKRVNVILEACDEDSRRPVERQIWRHVAQLYSARIDETEYRCTVITEALYGGTLLDAAEKLDVRHMNQERCATLVATVAREVLAAVVTLHSTLGVFHNDLKLDNVMLIQPVDEHACGCFRVREAAAIAEQSPCTAAHVKVIDFGCASVVDPEHARDPGTFLRLPQRGSLGAMSPERLRGERYGAPGDAWSVGVLLLQLARGGRHPFLNPPATADEPTVFTAPEQRFWHLAKVLQFTEDAEECRTATAAAVAAACDDTPLRGDAEFRAFINAAIEADPQRRASVATLQRHPWLQQVSSYC